jgi:hypothetical protein
MNCKKTLKRVDSALPSLYQAVTARSKALLFLQIRMQPFIRLRVLSPTHKTHQTPPEPEKDFPVGKTNFLGTINRARPAAGGRISFRTDFTGEGR